MKPKLIGIDFETYYATDYTLSKLSTPEYIMDPRFSVHGLSAVVADGPNAAVQWVPHDKVRTFFDKLNATGPWAMVGHNLLFDGSICAYRYNWRPAQYIDTLGMSRALLGGKLRSHSLDSLSQYLFQTGKHGGGAALAAVKGMTTADLYAPQNAPLLRALVSYAKQDIALTVNILRAFQAGIAGWVLPEAEYDVLDWTIRMATQPRLGVDLKRLAALHENEIKRRGNIIDAAGIDASKLRSAPQFARVLEGLLAQFGETVPTKISPKTGSEIPALAISDAGFLDLLEHEDETVRAVCEARKAAQSNILTTRAAKFTKIGTAMRGHFPVTLAYAGAVATHRLSGAGGTNVQNLKRGSELRKALIPPRGHVVITSDLSNIELRTNLALSGQWDALNILASGDDLYADYGTFAFGKPVNKKDTPDLRQMAKVAVLALGYYGGAATLQRALRWQAGIKVTLEQAQELVDAYRKRFSAIPALWRVLGNAIRDWSRGYAPPGLQHAPFLLWGNDYVEGPSGLRLTYPGVCVVDDLIRGQQYVFTSHSKTRADGVKLIHAGLLCENLNQWLAREIITEQAMRLRKRGLPGVMQVHDELVFVVKESEADAARLVIAEEMSKSPVWWPNLPVACETGVGATYGDAK